MSTPTSRFGIWVFRFFQFCFAVTLTGVFAYFHERISHTQYGPLYQVDVPLGFSVTAIFFTAAYIITIVSVSSAIDWFYVFIDFALWVGYLASSILYRHNFHFRCNRNELYYFSSGNINGGIWVDLDRGVNCSLIRLGAALIIIQIILFFCTMLLSTYVAVEKKKAPAGEPTPVGEKRRIFGKRRPGQTIDSTGPPASSV